MSRALPLLNIGGLRSEGSPSRADSFLLIDKFLLFLILSKEFIFDFFGVGMVINIAICLLVFFRVMASKWIIPSHVVTFVLVVCFWFVISILQGGLVSLAVSNLSRLVQVGFYLMYLAFLLDRFKEAFYNAYEKSVLLFNVILIANMAMMLIQYAYPGRFVAVTTGMEFSGVDTICGFFGAGSTHAVALFMTFVLLYNVEYTRTHRDIRGLMSLYTIGISTFALVFSLIVDNKAFPFFLLLGFMLYIIICVTVGRLSLAKNVNKLILVFGIVFLLLTFPPVFDSIMRTLGNYVNIALAAFNPSTYVNGSDERFQMVTYALMQPSTWMFGDGFGAAGIYQPLYRGYSHFGMNDFGSLVLLGGIWFYALVVCIYVKGCLTKLDFASSAGKALFGSTIAFVVASTIYTQAFTQVRIAIPMMLCLVFLRSVASDNRNKTCQLIQCDNTCIGPAIRA